ncbi:MAG TPA: cysteine desulfurase family protein [Candidatus Lokiarchaeia archaeon]|nr:cysteine desulfurase family protein [Candidatus Lokiarchaeia archaeon]
MVAGDNNVYLDYQSAKPVDPEVLEAMKPYMLEKFGNASSLHEIGDLSTEALEESRKTIRGFINAENAEEIIFTSGATESNNLALIGYATKNSKKGKHVIISEVEHISIHNICKFLEKNGFEVSKVPVDFTGTVRLDKLEERIRPDTILISIQYASNEIGTIQPIAEIGKIARERGITFHVDAVAAEGQIPIDVQADNIDLLTLSSNDIYGPRGVGVLYVRRGISLNPIIIGGGQERGLRSGTEDIAGIVGMAKATEITMQVMSDESTRLQQMRDRMIEQVLEIVPKSHLNGHKENRLPNNAHFRFDYIEGESILISFKNLGLAVSTGSACSSKTLEPSHTLMSLGLLHEEAHGSLEITTGRWTTDADIDRFLEVLPGIVERLRAMSPLTKREKLEEQCASQEVQDV